MIHQMLQNICSETLKPQPYSGTENRPIAVFRKESADTVISICEFLYRLVQETSYFLFLSQYS